jgi:DNA-binding NtrC family response regulator
VASETREAVLLVDDDEDLRASVARFLRSKGYEVGEFGDCHSALNAMANRPWKLALIDEGLPDGSGLDLMRRIRALQPDIGAVILTGQGTIAMAVEAIKEGAQHFLTKPVDMQAILVVFERIVEAQQGRRKRLAEERREDREAVDPFLGSSDAIRRLADEAQRLVGLDRPVLIQGETGSGKGVLARWLHARGPRRAEAFVDLNCASLSRELLESELFGHEAGAFTGATKRKLGLLEVAHRGTAFLDEIGDMDAAIQPRLLKVIEERRLRRVGDIRDQLIDVALIAATHQDLRRLMAERRFREDLYFRISALPLVVPPLRERRDDIPLLARHFADRVAGELGREPIPISDGALGDLSAYAWPGNVRELRNVIERAVIVGRGRLIDRDDIVLGHAPELATDAAGAEESLTLAEMERRHIAAALEKESGRVAAAARRLGISASSLYERLKRQAGSPPVPGDPSRK